MAALGESAVLQLRDLPEVCQADVFSIYTPSSSPGSLSYGLDLLMLILHVLHLGNDQLLPASLGPELWDFSMPKAWFS